MLTVAAALAHKNLDRLLEAMTGVDGDAALVMVGHAGRDAERLKARPPRWASPSRFRLTGWVEDDELEGLYRLAHCVRLPVAARGVRHARARGDAYGARPLVSGELTLDGRPYRPATPAQAVRAGVALVAEERGSAAVVPSWSVRHHVSLPRLRDHSRAAMLSRRAPSGAARAAPSPTSGSSAPGSRPT